MRRQVVSQELDYDFGWTSPVQEHAQLNAIRTQIENKSKEDSSSQHQRDFEGGFGGQEDLEDRYATTSGEH